jgi:hemin uptake protein HemP
LSEVFPTKTVDISLYLSNFIKIINGTSQKPRSQGSAVAMRKFEERDQALEAECENASVARRGEALVYASRALFKKGHEIRIDHNGAIYTLRVTRSGGLILNK